jgi:hypothetical protein
VVVVGVGVGGACAALTKLGIWKFTIKSGKIAWRSDRDAAMPTHRSNHGVIDKQLIHCRPAMRLAGKGCAAGSLDRGI